MNKYLYDEVYIVGVDHAISSGGELKVCGSFESLLEYLKTKSVSINPGLRVVHGVLTSAKSIPKDFKTRQPFIILTDPTDPTYGILLDSDTEDDCTELASEIERVLESEEAASFFFEIDHVFILYGYELGLTLSVDEDDIDEEIISDCLEVADTARELIGEDD